MQSTSETRRAILRRLSQLEIELREARQQLNELERRDPGMAEAVLRGAQLSREKCGLERRLEVMGLDPTHSNS